MKRITTIAALMVLTCLCFVMAACGISNTASHNADASTQNSTASSAANEASPASKDDLSVPVSEHKEPSQLSEDTEKTAADVLVVYFSATGNTKGIAQKIAEATGADLYEIVPKEPYTEAHLDWHNSDSRTTHEQNDKSIRPEMAGNPLSLDGYTTIFVGYPIWWGEEPRMMDTFVESYDFSGKTMIPFCTSGSSGIGSSGDNLKDHAGSGNWIEGRRFSAGTAASEVQEWINSLALTTAAR